MLRAFVFVLILVVAPPLGVVGWLVWPTPSLNINYGKMVREAYDARQCDDALAIARMMYFVDPHTSRLLPRLVERVRCQEHILGELERLQVLARERPDDRNIDGLVFKYETEYSRYDPFYRSD